MQKAFEDIVERLEELKKDVVDGKCPFKRNSRNCELQYSCETCYLTKAIKIVNRAARGYSHRNSDLVIDSSHRIEGLDDVINRLQYKADNIKAKLEPSYFTECIDYLKSLNNDWIPVSSGELPIVPKGKDYVDVLITKQYLSDAVVIPTEYYEDDGFNDYEKELITAWKYDDFPQPYVKEK